MSDPTDNRPVAYGMPVDPLDPFWQEHRMGGCVIDLSDPATQENLRIEREHRKAFPELHGDSPVMAAYVKCTTARQP
jgi:hypothetical protein